MSTIEHQCITLACDECGDALNPADEGEMHFGSVGEARNDARRYFEWTGDDERDLCPTCTAHAQCVELGHIPALDVRGEYCDRCEEKL